MLDTHEKRPLYLQLTDALLKQIVDEYQADDKLPTEMELCDEYAVSRTTVRLAMSAVSYTHLDVYKRQAWTPWCASRVLPPKIVPPSRSIRRSFAS